ncbi:MAG: hydrogenase iron-sulfur subunit [Euryarchaeota archaeon]|nr:hydrogenase iron-sulfur subunit [Euryarchaeota archaeon]
MGIISLAEELVNRAFTSRYNPLFYLGQIAVFLLLLTAISGIYMLPFYKINTQNAYISVDEITKSAIGGVMRSIHRYAADALVVVLLLHAARTFMTRRLLQSRWLVWVSGVLLLGAVMIEGLTGYWMVWDQRAQLVALSVTEFLDVLPIFPKPLALALAGEENLTSLLFFAVVFTHLALPLFSMALLLLHFSRFSGTRALPPSRLAAVVLAVVLAVSLAKPATSASPAALNMVPVNVPVDWYYMFLLPPMQSHPHITWLLLLSFTVLLLAAPWLLQRRRVIAGIRRNACVGCELCYADCPYGAINMLKDNGKTVASVSEGRCAGCGVCIGSCSFGAVELEDMELEELRRRVRKLAGEGKALVLMCTHCLGKDAEERLKLAGAEVLSLRCIGMLHPSAVEEAIDAGAEKVIIAGCKLGDCRYRLGNLWMQERLSGRRAPVLRHTEATQVEVCWLMPGEEEVLIASLSEKSHRRCGEEKPAPLLALLMLLLVALPLSYFSTSPAYSLIQEDRAVLLFTMSHTGERLVPCREPTMEELRAGNITPCPRERSAVEVLLLLDGKTLLNRSYPPSGLWKDGPSHAYERLLVEPGIHTLEVRIGDTRDGRFSHKLKREVRFEAGKVVHLRFEKGRFSVGE